MSMTEQKFSAIESFSKEYRILVSVSHKNNFVRIFKAGFITFETTGWDTIDQALTESLRFLRKDTKQPKP